MNDPDEELNKEDGDQVVDDVLDALFGPLED